MWHSSPVVTRTQHTRFLQWKRQREFRQIFPALAILMLCAGTPLMLWTIWSKMAFGDATGSSEKMQILGWTHKSFWDWFEHPIFTFTGAWTFTRELIATFWHGEFGTPNDLD